MPRDIRTRPSGHVIALSDTAATKDVNCSMNLRQEHRRMGKLRLALAEQMHDIADVMPPKPAAVCDRALEMRRTRIRKMRKERLDKYMEKLYVWIQHFRLWTHSEL